MAAARINQLARAFFQLKEELREMNRIEKEIKTELHELMDERKCDCLPAGQYVLTRRPGHSEHIKREDIPRDLWEEYATLVEYKTISVNRR